MTDRSSHIETYTQTNRNLEKLWFPKVQKAIKSKVSALIAKINEDGVQAGVRYLHIDLGNYKLQAVIEDLYREVGKKYARKAETELRKSIKKGWSLEMEEKRIGFSQVWIDWIQNYLKLYLLEKITFKVNETTREKLLGVLNEGIEKGWGVTEIVSRLNELPFTAHQAARIVRTEINRAANVGVAAQGETFEYELMKEWIAVKDNRTRGVSPEDHSDHFHLDGQVVDFDGKFIDPRNGHELMHPGDPKAKSEDVINCRCNFSTKAKRDQDGNLILKPGKSHLPEMETKDMNKEAMIKMEMIDSGLSEVKEFMKVIAMRPNEVRVQLDSIHIQEAGLKHIEERFDEKFLAVDTKINSVGEMISERFTDVIEALDHSKRAYSGMVGIMKAELLGLIGKVADTGDSNVKQLIDLINSKVYNPEIKVEVNTGEILSELRSIRDELLKSNNGIEVSIEQILDKLNEKHKWQLTVQRNSDKLITGAVAQQI